jgi:hypothetical protein
MGAEASALAKRPARRAGAAAEMWLSAHNVAFTQNFSDNAFPPRRRGDVIGAGRRIMIDPNSRVGRELKAADEFFALARAAPTPFMRSYYQRVAERYLSSKGDLKAVERLGVSSTRASMS